MNSLAKGSDIEPRLMFEFIQSVEECIPMNEQLFSRLTNVAIQLEEGFQGLHRLRVHEMIDAFKYLFNKL